MAISEVLQIVSASDNTTERAFRQSEHHMQQLCITVSAQVMCSSAMGRSAPHASHLTVPCTCSIEGKTAQLVLVSATCCNATYMRGPLTGCMYGAHQVELYLVFSTVELKFLQATQPPGNL